MGLVAVLSILCALFIVAFFLYPAVDALRRHVRAARHRRRMRRGARPASPGGA